MNETELTLQGSAGQQLVSQRPLLAAAVSIQLQQAEGSPQVSGGQRLLEGVSSNNLANFFLGSRKQETDQRFPTDSCSKAGRSLPLLLPGQRAEHGLSHGAQVIPQNREAFQELICFSSNVLQL